jgi:response regulator RpfG family c-di-GMP phosphodiesterase
LPILSERREQESILVADPDVRVVELLQITLSGRGYDVRTVTDGAAALDEIERQRPDLIVLGVRLPNRTGFQIVEQVRADPRTARLPVILIAGSPSNESRIQGLRLGADDYLVKPFSPRELMIKIRTILDRTADLKVLQGRNERLRDDAKRQREEMLRAREEMGQYLGRINALLHHVEQVGHQRDLDALLATLVAACHRELGFARVCVFVPVRGSEGLRPRAWHGIDEPALRAVRLGAEDFLCQSVRLEARTMSADEFSGYPLAGDDLLRLAALGLTQMTPVLSEERELLALIAGGERRTAGPVDRLDLHLLEVLAHAAAVAMRDVQATREARRAFVETAAQLIAVVEGRYEHLRGHSARVHDLSQRIADQAALAPRLREAIGQVAWLHDLGALEEYAHLQEESRELSSEERLALRRRGSAGVRRLLESSQLDDVAAGLYHLPEYWSGAGVPDGLAGETIPVASRVVAIANAYDALTHARPYREAYTPDEALAILGERSGWQYDPALIEAFERVLGIEADADQSRSMPTMRGPESRSK